MSDFTRQGLEPLRTIGNDTPRIDAIERVTGQAKYTRDWKLPGMLYGKVLRSPHPHARLVSIDTSEAEALPGVQAVITYENAQVVWGAGSVNGGRQYNDPTKAATVHRRYIFNNPVRFVGDSIAAVAATDRHIAEEAVSRVPEQALAENPVPARGLAPKTWERQERAHQSAFQIYS